MTEDPRDWTRGVPTVLTSSCERCGHRWYVQRLRCPRCANLRQRRQPAAPTGVVVARTSISADLTPDGVGRTIALVDLDDGIRILARCSPDIAAGAAVRWFFPDVGVEVDVDVDADVASDTRQSRIPHVRAVE
jgi:uncharacterized OB-fold protein